jgi:3',5'-cyclic AMP phosphodiesterase CpdA
MKEQPNKPTILFLHHPPAKFRVSETDHDGFIGADLLGAVVRKFPSIVGILCGHIHLNAVTAWCGTIVNAAPSGTGMELALDLTLGKPSGFHLVNPAFLLHARTTDGAIVTHRIEVRQNVLTHQF